MESKRKLYPMKFEAVEIERSWGRERLALADLGVEDSVVTEGWLAENSIGDIMETYLERVVGDAVFAYYGRQFPLMVKYLDIDGELPVQVHPDDGIAEQRYDSLGGKELWYVVDPGQNSGLYLGFSRETSAQELYRKCLDGTLKDLLNIVRPTKGQTLVVEPGTVHGAFGKGLKIIVIKESSELPFSLYDAENDAAELASTHLAEAMDFINYKGAAPGNLNRSSAPSPAAGQGASSVGAREQVAECQEFSVSLLKLSEPLQFSGGENDSFLVLVCVSGEASVQVPGTDKDGKKTMESYALRGGETMMIPAETQDFFLVPVDRETLIIEAAAGHRSDIDEYIDPDTEPFLEGEDYEGLEDLV